MDEPSVHGFSFTTIQGALSVAWDLSEDAAPRGRFTHKVAGRSWEQAFSDLCNIAARDGPISEIQYLGHGSPGKVFLDEAGLDLKGLRGIPSFARFVAMTPFATDGTALLWWRTCSTFNEAAGKKFASELATLLGCRVAGHTVTIPTGGKLFVVQDGLPCVSPNQEATWADGSGSSLTFSPPALQPIFSP
jgi:hypothetical protein